MAGLHPNMFSKNYNFSIENMRYNIYLSTSSTFDMSLFLFFFSKCIMNQHKSLYWKAKINNPLSVKAILYDAVYIDDTFVLIYQQNIHIQYNLILNQQHPLAKSYIRLIKEKYLFTFTFRFGTKNLQRYSRWINFHRKITKILIIYQLAIIYVHINKKTNIHVECSH